MYKHFIKINEDGEITDAFCDAFRQPDKDSILVAETEERHFNLDFRTMEGVLRYTWDGKKMVERSKAEVEAIAKPIREKAETLARLADLDRVIPRSVEDLYSALKLEPYPAVKSAVEEKAVLRTKL
jgi:hypothetical protein